MYNYLFFVKIEFVINGWDLIGCFKKIILKYGLNIFKMWLFMKDILKCR